MSPELSRSEQPECEVSQCGIQAVADQFDITPRTLRFYEDKGLLSPRREAGARVFGPVEQGRLVRILRAKRLGFTLDDIKAVMDVVDGLITEPQELSRRKNNFKTGIQNLRRQRKDIDVLVTEMGELCHQIETHLETHSEGQAPFHMAEAYQAVFEDHFADDVLTGHAEK